MDGATHRSLARGADEESASKMTDEVPAEDATAGGWTLEALTVRKAENGAVIVTCSKSRVPKGKSGNTTYEDTHQSKDYAFTSTDDALGYIAQELGSSAPAGGSPRPTAAPLAY